MITGERSDAPKILLIEDDRAIAAGIVRGLSVTGFSVEHASSGRRGEELDRLGKFALIVLDLMLPELDGFAIREL